MTIGSFYRELYGDTPMFSSTCAELNSDPYVLLDEGWAFMDKSGAIVDPAGVYE